MPKILNRLVEKNPFLVEKMRSFFGSDLVNNSRLYEKFCLASAKRDNRRRPFGNLRLNIETTLACNSRCVFCSKQGFPLKAGTMSWDLYAKIIREAKELGLREAILSVYGEPLLDRQFLRRARLTDEAGINFLFFTNGSLLTEEVSKELLQLKKFTRINFSVNAFDKSTYEKVMVGLKRDVVYAHISKFLELKNALRPDLYVVVSCVLFEKNRDEKDKLRSYFQGLKGVNNVYFPMIRNRGGTLLDIEWSGEDVEFSPLSKRGHKLLPCKFLWEDLFIYWNGTVGVCCEDTAARRIIIGDLKKQSLSEVWTGAPMIALRELHMNGCRAEHPVCGKTCTYNTIWLK
ncbi:MAG: radical SAM/SPASM domain-containing protein [Candidatus Aminicenantales bacterium]